ncbi:hypothetical protein VHEMI01785 [[Torrubiella] hemipterigena]|uniref:DH domain-containing protein n=1 Tax=[Torrubiella] hemipterigena TaxID=1531966 RepID=A0A0A1T5V8_9HYPO|nr:hypothetical protein VHEMI01785 [[Torrubiella] hemipterigena]
MEDSLITSEIHPTSGHILNTGFMPFGTSSDHQPNEASETQPDITETLSDQLQNLHLQISLPDSRPSSTECSPNIIPATLADSRRNSDDTPDVMELDEDTTVPKPFHRWIRSLRRRAAHKRATGDHRRDESLFSSPNQSRQQSPSGRCKAQSSSGSSFNLLTTVRSAAVSTLSIGAAINPNTGVKPSRDASLSDENITMGHPERSASKESLSQRPQHTASRERSFQRRRILEELINTEEGYLGDLRFLMNVYITLFSSVPALSDSFRAAISHNLSQMIELHDEILGELHRAVPNSQYSATETHPPKPSPIHSQSHPHSLVTHRRCVSLDAVVDNVQIDRSDQNHQGMAVEPQVVGEVARIFGRKIKRFFVYTEYSARYEAIIQDLLTRHADLTTWSVYQRGLENLAAILDSCKNSDEASRRAMTVRDLLIKPIQRVCRYPLLFSELLKHTPEVDCPNSRMEIENSLFRLREATTEINRAADDLDMKNILQRT